MGVFILTFTFGFGQVFNYVHKDLAFKNLLKNDICFLKTVNAKFDSTMLDALDKYCTITDYTFVEQYKHPPKETTALFVTTKMKTKKHVMYRKNQHVLVLQPAKFWKIRAQVPCNETLDYMYFNAVQNTQKRTHYLLYYSVNTRTELSLGNILTGELIYTKHFPEVYMALKKKEWKLIAPYF